MAPKDHQYPYRTLLKGRSDGQNQKIQDYDLTVRRDSHMDTRGGLQLKEHRGGVHLQGAPPAEHPMYGLQVGVDDRFHEGPSQRITLNRSVD